MALKIATKQEEADKEKNKQILQTASSYTVDSIVKGLAELQLEFGGIVSGLSEKLSKETSKLDELKRAIEVETQNLQELQRIRVVADTLYILNQEHQAKIKADLYAKEVEGQKRFYEQRVQSLEQTIQNQEGRIQSLVKQLETTSRQVQDLAVKAIEGAANVNSYQTVKEIALKQAKNAQKNK